MSDRFVGAGWSFPIRLDATGRVELVRMHREIEESIELILRTAPGERPMRPDFGCAIHDEIFGPADASTAGRIVQHVSVALDRWEPRIDVESVDVSFDGVDDGCLYIEIHYSVRGTYDPRNLVFPFYVIPREQRELPSATDELQGFTGIPDIDASAAWSGIAGIPGLTR
jgi:phage baseplate assembly protein W